MTIEWTPDTHPEEDVFEDYAFARLREEDASGFEEHLLVCEDCQHALARTDEYILLVKAAVAADAARERKPRLERFRFRDHQLRWNTVGAAGLLFACLMAMAVLSSRTLRSGPQTVVLEAYRAGGISAIAPAGRPLDLNIDLTDVQPAARYQVEVVDATGSRVWLGATPARLTKGLAPGTYWVRLSTDTGQPLREFGLTAAR